MRLLAKLIALLTVSLAVGCGSDDEPKEQPKACDPVAQTGCDTGQVCELGPGQGPACYAPVSIQGKVFDAYDASPVEGAHVVARDPNDAVISSVAITDKDGNYDLRVPAPRDANGKPVSTSYTLRADASGYLTFPKAPRIALPVDISTASGDPLVVKSVATDIGLVPLENAAGLGSISGKVLAKNPGGTLVVAGGVTGTADTEGDYTVFNVPAGSVEVRGYLAGVNLETKSADVKAGETTGDVDLGVLSDSTATVSGKVEIVNAPGGADTSVILVVEDTFVENAARGEAPAGLRAEHVSGDFSIPGVPDGKYVVLAAFENDGLVRDPDTSIGGTEIVHITVAGDSVPIAQGFKVTGALAVYSPDGGDTVSGMPTFSFEDDSSEDSYTVQVFDVLGNEVWKKEGFVGPKGNKPVDVPFDGDLASFESGKFYQFRATSIKDGVPISATEDLKGVFVYQ